MSPFNPLVTILIPVYNGEKYLKEAIESALGQSYEPIEIMVINDGSTDKTEAIIKSYDQKLHYYKKANGGVATALNLGIKKAKGEYISWLSADDTYSPQKIATQITSLTNLPSDQRTSTILYSNFGYIDEKSDLVNQVEIEKYHPIDRLNTSLYPTVKGLVFGGTLLIPKRCFTEVGDYDPTLRSAQDYELWFRMFPKYRVRFERRCLAFYRQHLGQGIHSIKSKQETNEFWINLMKRMTPPNMVETDGSVANFYFTMHKQMQHFGNLKAATFAKQQYSLEKETTLTQLGREIGYLGQPLFRRLRRLC
jgi:glycosyltransferase involved in cell wall biosynthesis